MKMSNKNLLKKTLKKKTVIFWFVQKPEECALNKSVKTVST